VLTFLIIVAANPTKQANITQPQPETTWLQKLALTGIFVLQYSRMIMETPRLASVEEKSDKWPLALLIGSGFLLKCTFGYFGAQLIQIKASDAINKVESGSVLAATIGSLVVCVLSRLISDQSKVLNTLSLNSVPFTVEITLFVFLLPWLLAAAINSSLFAI